MKLFEKKWVKYTSGVVGACLAGIIIMFGATKVVYPAISSLVGLAVAQSATLWNNVKDAAAGDGLVNGILAQSSMLWNGSSFDRVRGDITNGMDVDVTRISGSITPADAYANPTTANQVWSLAGIFNGTTWDRWRSSTADGAAATGFPGVTALLNNGTTLDRQYGVSGTINTTTLSRGVAMVANVGTWFIQDSDVGATQSTASKAAGGGTVRHVVTNISACRGDTAVAAPALVHLRDGATGAGTIIRSWVIGVPVANESECVNISGLNISGSANTAMTIEFAAAGSATSTSSVGLSGYSTP